jgi:hypothetical protein
METTHHTNTTGSRQAEKNSRQQTPSEWETWRYQRAMKALRRVGWASTEFHLQAIDQQLEDAGLDDLSILDSTPTLGVSLTDPQSGIYFQLD